MAAVRLWGRGQLTIPAALRRELHLDDEDVVLDVNRVGDALLITPRKLSGDRLARRAEKQLKKAGLSLDDLLEELERQRSLYNKERYGA